MSETLKQKIDNAFRNRISEHWTAHQIDKALQEFREQIMALSISGFHADHKHGAWIKREDVLALIGEKNE